MTPEDVILSPALSQSIGKSISEVAHRYLESGEGVELVFSFEDGSSLMIFSVTAFTIFALPTEIREEDAALWP